MRVKKNGQSTIEFAVLIIFLLGAFLVLQKYIVRGFSGRWKGVGDALGEGRIFDPHTTTQCAFYPPSGVWYDRACFEERCEQACLRLTGSGCADCITGCHATVCD